MFFYNLMDLPNKIQVELVNDNMFTDILLIINIFISVIVAWYIRDRIEKKAKEYEVKAYIQKIKADNIIKFGIKANSIFSKICIKNPNINPINKNDIHLIDKLIISKESIFLDKESIENIINFRDYIIGIMNNPKNKKLNKEKSYFFLIKKIINNE